MEFGHRTNATAGFVIVTPGTVQSRKNIFTVDFQLLEQSLKGERGDPDTDLGDGIGDGVQFLASTRVFDFDEDQDANADYMSSTTFKVVCEDNNVKRIELDIDTVVLLWGKHLSM